MEGPEKRFEGFFRPLIWYIPLPRRWERIRDHKSWSKGTEVFFSFSPNPTASMWFTSHPKKRNLHWEAKAGHTSWFYSLWEGCVLTCCPGWGEPRGVGSWLEARTSWTCFPKSVDLWESSRAVPGTQLSSSHLCFLPGVHLWSTLDSPATPGNHTHAGNYVWKWRGTTFTWLVIPQTPVFGVKLHFQCLLCRHHLELTTDSFLLNPQKTSGTWKCDSFALFRFNNPQPRQFLFTDIGNNWLRCW